MGKMVKKGRLMTVANGTGWIGALVIWAGSMSLACAPAADARGDNALDASGFGRKYKFADNEIAGWGQDTSATAYSVWTPANLTEKINGGADAYVRRGCQLVMYQDLVGPDPKICTVAAMDFSTDAKAISMFTFQQQQTHADVTVPQYTSAEAIGSATLTGITVFAHFKTSYFEIQLDGEPDQTAATQVAQKFLDVLKGKTQ